MLKFGMQLFKTNFLDKYTKDSYLCEYYFILKDIK